MSFYGGIVFMLRHKEIVGLSLACKPMAMKEDYLMLQS